MSLGLYESIHDVFFAEFIIFEYPNGVGALFIVVSLPKPNRESPGKKKRDFHYNLEVL